MLKLPIFDDVDLDERITGLQHMKVSLPYLPTPGSLKTALERIRTAATPDRVTGDFVQTKLQIKGGTGSAIPPYLKKIGFVASDGSPTDIYRRYRNAATAPAALAEAVVKGYEPLREANEYFYELSDKELKDLIVQVTGSDAEASTAKMTLSTLKILKENADFDPPEEASKPQFVDKYIPDTPAFQPESKVQPSGLRVEPFLHDKPKSSRHI